ncbi:MAG TPA: hypothetical protein VGR25_03335 [bacterium]|nr:hypothetical protein [bacterium]
MGTVVVYFYGRRTPPAPAATCWQERPFVDAKVVETSPPFLVTVP